MRFAIHILMLLIVAFSSGSHLAVLQTVAWIGMIVENVQDEGALGRAFSQAFDGEHPCGLCEVIDEAALRDGGSDGDEVPRPSGPLVDVKLQPLERLVLLHPAPRRLGHARDHQICIMRESSPSVPPPRLA